MFSCTWLCGFVSVALPSFDSVTYGVDVGAVGAKLFVRQNGVLKWAPTMESKVCKIFYRMNPEHVVAGFNTVVLKSDRLRVYLFRVLWEHE